MHVSTPSSKRTKETTAVRMCALACARAAMSCVVRPPVRPLERQAAVSICAQPACPAMPLLLETHSKALAITGPHDGVQGARHCSSGASSQEALNNNSVLLPQALLLPRQWRWESL